MALSPLLLLSGGFALIVAGSSLFTRSLERTVLRFFNNKNRGLRILGNISLSLPELLLPLIAFLAPGAGTSRVEAGTGAIFGPPLFLLLFLFPLAFFLTQRESQSLARELPLLLGGVALGLLLFDHSLILRLILSLFLAGLYLWGLFSTVDHEEVQEEESGSPWGILDALSVAGGSLLMGGGSQLFLVGIDHLRSSHGISPFWSALILAPLATEAPELLTLLHFLKRRSMSEGLAILWGSIHLQTTLSIAMGLVASPWRGSQAARSAGETLLLLLGALLLLSWKRGRSLPKTPSRP
jgi:Ca2+/Na+ antiporter